MPTATRVANAIPNAAPMDILFPFFPLEAETVAGKCPQATATFGRNMHERVEREEGAGREHGEKPPHGVVPNREPDRSAKHRAEKQPRRHSK
jgi:hypothetical protein